MEKFINLRNLAFVLFLNSANLICAQNVGIGTTNPLSKLHINGQLRVDTFLAGSSNDSIVTIDANGVFRRLNASAISGQNIYNTNGILTNNRSVFMGTNTLDFDTATLFLNPSLNRVGVGTNSPGYQFSVRRDDTLAIATIEVRNSTTRLSTDSTPNAQILFGGYRDVTTSSHPLGAIRSFAISADNGNVRSGEIGFFTNQGQVGVGYDRLFERMRISRFGNVGIGTSAPSTRLDVDGGLRVRVLNSGVSTDSIVTVDATGVFRRRNANIFNTNLFNSDGTLTGNRTVSQGANTITFTGSSVNSFSVDGSTFSVDGANNRVGVGTNSPLETMDIRGNMFLGNSDTTNFIAFRGLTTDGNGFYTHTFLGNRLYGGSDKSEFIIYQGNDADNVSGPDRIRMMSGEHRFQTLSSNTGNITFPGIARDTLFVDRMIIRNDGKVGIGTTTPTDLLDVNGTARVRTMAAASNTDNLVYADANGVLKRGNQTGKLLNYVAIDDPAMSNTSFSSTTLTDLISFDYTPVSNNSKIIVEYQNQNYTMSGVFSTTAVDDWEAWLQVGAFYPTVNYWRASNNSSDIYRSSNLLPIKGVYTNNSTNPVNIKVQIKRVSSDDTITFRQGNGGWNGSLIIQEIGN